MAKRGKEINLQNVRSSVGDGINSASLIDRISVSANSQEDLLVLRGIEAGPGISIKVVDFDNDAFDTTEKKIVISLEGAVPPSPEPEPDYSNTDIAPGTYLNPTLTVDEHGHIVSIQNGVSAAHIGEVNTGENIGIGNGLFARKSGVKLQFKTIIPGEGIDIQEFSDQIIISSFGTGPESGYCFKYTGLTREFVEDGCAIVIPQEHQIMVYGRYNVRGKLVNYGKLVIL